MGFAKYMEDNNEIISERLALMEERERCYAAKQSTLKMTINISSMVIAEKVFAEVKRKKKSIVCRDCGKVFTFSVQDQLFYEKKGWDSPKRCKACREHRKIRYLMYPAY